MDNLSVQLKYSILDPTGNITALVESDVEAGCRPAAAAEIMRRHPEVEQVGFVRFFPFGEEDEAAEAELLMAGGEFCGNAAMSAAALYLIRQKKSHAGEGNGRKALELEKTGCSTEIPEKLPLSEKKMTSVNGKYPLTVRVRVSGAETPVEVCLLEESPDCFRAGVHMPPAKEIRVREFVFDGLHGNLPVVQMEGIFHIIIGRGSAFFALRDDREAAGRAVRAWCHGLEAEGLGLMFLEEGRLTPLVYIPGSDTEFWENSCASGTSATGMYLASESGVPVSEEFREPGGCLRVESSLESGETWLYGRTKLTGSY